MDSLFRTKLGRHKARQRIESYLDRIYGYACSLINDRDRARDLVQICAVKALSAKKVPVDEPAYRAWLFKIVRNAYHDEIRKEKRDTVSLDHHDEDADILWNKIVGSHVSTNEQVIIDKLTVRTALRQLNRDHREILVLVDMAGFSYREAAELLEVPVGTIMSRVSRARCMLFQELNRDQQASDRLKVVRLEK
ncbi:MAG: RNA polymerase sigma factor [Sedimenticola sp.]